MCPSLCASTWRHPSMHCSTCMLCSGPSTVSVTITLTSGLDSWKSTLTQDSVSTNINDFISSSFSHIIRIMRLESWRANTVYLSPAISVVLWHSAVSSFTSHHLNLGMPRFTRFTFPFSVQLKPLLFITSYAALQLKPSH